jgi:hypothetical protein
MGEERNIKLTLDQAWTWYNSGNSDLRSLALSVFSESELKGCWKGIKTYEDACKLLGVPGESIKEEELKSDHLGIILAFVMYRIGVIREALNGNWKPSMLDPENGESTVWYPKIFLYADEIDAKCRREYNLCGDDKTVSIDGTEYHIVLSTKDPDENKKDEELLHRHHRRHDGISLDMSRGIFGCRSEEIAQHFGKYFANDIINAVFAQYFGVYAVRMLRR